MGNAEISIAAAVDQNYAMPLSVMLFSLGSHLRPDVSLNVYVLNRTLDSSHRRRIEQSLQKAHLKTRLVWLAPEVSALRDLKIRGHLTVATYYRLLLPDLVPGIEKILYLDCDLLVRRSVEDLFNEDSGAFPACAVQGFGAPYASCKYGIPEYESLGIPADSPCFNAGVLLMNLKRWRDEKVSEHAIDMAWRNSSQEIKLNDQLALNMTLPGRWGKLDPRWNQMHPVFRFDEWPASPFRDEISALMPALRVDPWIVHFTSASKPWQRGCRHPFTGEFLRELRRSGWFRTPLGYWIWYWFGRKRGP